MTTLSDTQLILLSTASQRKDGHLMPLPENVTAPTDRVTKAIAALIKRGFVTETETIATDQHWRSDGDVRLTVLITDAGREAIDGKVVDSGSATLPVAPAKPDTPQPRSGSKQAKVLELLGRENGATLAELIDATGWLSHTTRAAMTSLRKKGHNIINERIEGGSRYRLVVA